MRYIVGRSGIRDAYRTGRGRVVMRARAHIEELRGGKSAIIISELPYGVKKGGDNGVIKKIADLVNDKVLTEISDLADHSDRSGMRIQVELKRDAIPQVALNKLFKHTPLQSTFGVQRRRARQRHAADAVVARARHALPRLPARDHHAPLEGRAAQEGTRAHILAGYLIALDNLDAVIALIRAAADTEGAKNGLMETFELSEQQALGDPRAAAARTDGARAPGRRERVQGHPGAHRRAARAALGRGEDRRADQGRAARAEGDLRPQRRPPHGDRRRRGGARARGHDRGGGHGDRDHASGYIKRLPVTAYREQRRGGIGVMGMDLKDEDYIEHLFVASTHDYILFFTTVGKVYRLKVHELPLGSRQSKGRAIVNLLPFRQGEQVRAVIQTRNFEEAKYLLFATKNGVVKKTELAAYNTTLKADGIIAIKMREGDELIGVRHSLRRRRRADGLAQRPGDPLLRAGRARDGPRRLRRAGHAAPRRRRGDLGRDRAPTTPTCSS